MNPQPSIYVGQLFAIAFTCLFLFYFIKELLSNNSTISNCDLFTLGYIEESNNVTLNIKNNIVKKQSKPNFESQQLYIDCIDALHAIGVKKSEAKKIAKHIFSTMKNPPTTIQDFLIIALRKT